PYLYFYDHHSHHRVLHSFPTRRSSDLPKLSSTKLPMSYAMALIQLEKKVYSNPKFVEIIEQSQQKVLRQLSVFDNNYLHPSIIADRKSTRLNSSHVKISYAVFCLKKKK